MVLTALHHLHQSLLDLGICTEGSLEVAGISTRDRPEVSGLRCKTSGIVVLDSIDHIDAAYYPDKKHATLAELGTRAKVVKTLNEDTTRRADQFRDSVIGKHWLDIGTGAGAILDALSDDAASISAVEPQGEFQAILRTSGYEVHSNIRDVSPDSIDIATLFHVFEHLPEPFEDLQAIKTLLKPGGAVVIEIPHALDALLTRYESESFGRFTIWAEHLLLHTRDSLRTMLSAAGFENIVVSGFQRYPLANTLHWLSQGKPAGQVAWSDLRDSVMEARYAAKLDELDMTDTLIATATAP